MNISHKRIILTGASSGIGEQLLKLLIRYEGVRIIGVARDVNNMLVCEDKVYPFAADLSTQDGVDSVFRYANNLFGDIDIFIANAGFAYIEKLQAADWQHIQDIYNLNVFSPVYSLEKLAETPTADKKLFVCTVSGAGLVSLPGYSLYCSTKAALDHFFKTYRFEKRSDVHIMTIYPVAIRTRFFDKAMKQTGTPLPFPGQNPDAVARKIIAGIIKGKKTVYPSFFFRILYPIGRAFPVLLNIYSLLEKKKLTSLK